MVTLQVAFEGFDCRAARERDKDALADWAEEPYRIRF